METCWKFHIFLPSLQLWPSKVVTFSGLCQGEAVIPQAVCVMGESDCITPPGACDKGRQWAVIPVQLVSWGALTPPAACVMGAVNLMTPPGTCVMWRQ